ncbi:MAG: 4Fe-4S binding protein [Candidatus Helarchaeota archaeon]|nr:4Fe-4S binding protein [Candidatus Helarchaeota archaeon]
MPIPKALKSYAAQMGFPNSETMARIFEILYDEEDDLKVVKALSRPRTMEKLIEKTGLPEKRVREIVELLLSRGAISQPMKSPDLYRLFPAMIELRDASCLNPNAPQELFELWEKIVYEELPPLISMLENLKIPPVMRVIPIERSVEVQNAVLDPDSARKIFQDAEIVSVIPCVCRKVARKNNRSQDCPAPEDAVCMQTNGFAKMILKTGIAEQISNEEAVRRISLAEEAGLVHMVRNNIKKDMFMCNCCSCCCTGLYITNQVGYLEGIAPSRFRAKLNVEACVGCGTCETRCQFHAISLDEVASINHEKCYGCGNCVITCPEEALVLEEIRPLEHIRVT